MPLVPLCDVHAPGNLHLQEPPRSASVQQS